MSILKVAMLGNPVLRRKASAVKDAGHPDVQRLVDDMLETMKEYNGVGLAGPQVHMPVRVIVVEAVKGAPWTTATALINPGFEPLSQQKGDDWEGCLSIANMRGQVPRFRQIRVSSLDRKGKALTFEATEFLARVIQHEVDHLEGVLFLDRMKDFATLTHMEEWQRFWLKKPV
ncbi:MAG: peptide deformylase [Candidatus Brocadiae bacterium]|nr:peptide deformylase [Candidatus Brocadiia bacterium]